MSEMNELQLIILRKQQLHNPVAFVPERHYGLLVSLMRADRPRHWNFRCINCGSKVGEIMNMEVMGLDDFFDPQNTLNYAEGRHCKGVEPDGTPCPYKYWFKLQ